MNIKYNGDYLKNLRMKQHKTQEQLSDILGVSRQTISDYENGKKQPSMSKAKILSEYFNVSFLSIIYGDEQYAKYFDEDEIEKKQIEKYIIREENKDYNIFGEIETINDTRKIGVKKDNKNTLVIGNKKSGKTEYFTENQIVQSIQNNENLFVSSSDTKIVEKYYNLLTSNGYDIKILNLKDIAHSHSWRLIDEFQYNNTIFENFLYSEKEICEHDEQVLNAMVYLLKYLCFIVKDIEIESFETRFEKNVDLLRDLNYCRNLLIEKNEQELEEMIKHCCHFKQIEAKRDWDLYKAYNQDIRNNAKTKIINKLEDVSTFGALKYLFRVKDIDLNDLYLKKSAYFVIYSDDIESINLYATFFISQAFSYCLDSRTKNHLKKHNDNFKINFILDDFHNAFIMQNLMKYLSNNENYLSISLVLQNIEQLKNKYKNWKELFFLFDNVLIFSNFKFSEEVFDTTKIKDNCITLFSNNEYFSFNKTKIEIDNKQPFDCKDLTPKWIEVIKNIKFNAAWKDELLY